MIGALLYLQLESIKNRLRMRLRRLKKPKYLAGAAVGAAYFYFFFFRNLFGGRRSVAAEADAASTETLLLFELVGALALFLMVLSAWIFPHERAALLFSEAEIAFLFPAPVTRRTYNAATTRATRRRRRRRRPPSRSGPRRCRCCSS